MIRWEAVDIGDALAAYRKQGYDGPDEHARKIAQGASLMEIAYAGGQKAKEYFLKRKMGESPESWQSRTQHAKNVGLAPVVINTHSRLLYSHQPTRDVWLGEKPKPLLFQVLAARGAEPVDQGGDEAQDALQEWINAVYHENSIDSLTMRATRRWFICGRAPVKVWPVEGSLRMDLFAAHDVLPIQSPDDPDTWVGVLEARRHGKETSWRVWTADATATLRGSEWTDEEPHDYGRPPFSFLGDGVCPFPDLPDQQAHLVNLESVRWTLARSQAFSVPVLAGKILNQSETDGGNTGTPMGWDRHIHLTEGSFTFVKPDADFAELREDTQSVLAQALYCNDLPPTTALDGAAAEQPMTVALRWLAALGRRREHVVVAEAFEEDLLSLTSRMVDVFFLDTGAEEIGSEVRFVDNPLPQDTRLDQDKARQDVASGLMLKEQYIIEHVVKGWDRDMVLAYLEALKAQKEADRAPLLNSTGFSFGLVGEG